MHSTKWAHPQPPPCNPKHWRSHPNTPTAEQLNRSQASHKLWIKISQKRSKISLKIFCVSVKRTNSYGNFLFSIFWTPLLCVEWITESQSSVRKRDEIQCSAIGLLSMGLLMVAMMMMMLADFLKSRPLWNIVMNEFINTGIYSERQNEIVLYIIIWTGLHISFQIKTPYRHMILELFIPSP